MRPMSERDDILKRFPRLGRPVFLTWAGLCVERVLRGFWPLATFMSLILAALMFGAGDLVAPSARPWVALAGAIGAVFLFGSAKDEAVAAEINQLCAGACQDFTGKTSMTEAIDLMSLCDVVVSNDSGLMHVAAALDKKLVALYGSSDPGFTPPLHPDARIISLGLDCSPCFKRECPLEHLNCLRNILPERVTGVVNELLA